MSHFTFSPLDLGLHVVCACGSEMLLKAKALRADRPVYCPCGGLEFIPEKTIDAYQAVMLRKAAEAKNES